MGEMQCDRAAVWGISVLPPVNGDVSWRARLLERIKPAIIQHNRQRPDESLFTIELGLFTVRAQLLSGSISPGGAMQLEYVETLPERVRNGDADEGCAIRRLSLPDPKWTAVGEQIVGLEPTVNAVLLHLHCRWSDRLQQWSKTTSSTVPSLLSQELTLSAPCFVFHGDPGTGKTTTATVIADRFARETGRNATLFSLSTAEARGTGLVGCLGRRVAAVFETAVREAQVGPVFILIDEAEALALSRSDTASHHEDRAGCSVLIQSLDSLAGARVAVFLTTNLVNELDAAIRRRSREIYFPRPNLASRRVLLAQWLPKAEAKFLHAAAGASRRMTPADLNRELTDWYLQAIANNRPMNRVALLRRLHRAKRARRV